MTLLSNATVIDGDLSRVAYRQATVRVSSTDGLLLLQAQGHLNAEGALITQGNEAMQLASTPAAGPTSASALPTDGKVATAMAAKAPLGDDLRNTTPYNDATALALAGVHSNAVVLKAGQDLVLTGSQVRAQNSASLQAGGDVRVIRQVTSDSVGQLNARGQGVVLQSTTLGAPSSVSVTNNGGTLTVDAARDVTLTAAQLSVGTRSLDTSATPGAGGIAITAGRDITLDTVTTSRSAVNVRDAKNFTKSSSTQDVGTSLQSQGAIVLKAGNNLTATAAQIGADGGVLLKATNGDVQLLAGQTTSVLESASQSTKRNVTSKKTTTTYDFSSASDLVSTQVSGQTVSVQAGRDILGVATNIVSDLGTSLNAGRDVLLQAGVSSSTEIHEKTTKKSGLMGGGGFGISIGSRQITQKGKDTLDAAVGSTVGSVSGDVTITAGGNYTQVGSDLAAPKGDITVKAQSIDIRDARDLATHEQQTLFRQSGVTVSVSAPAVAALQSATQVASAAQQTKDPRMQALAAASAAMSVKDAVAGAQALASDPSKAGVTLSVSLGTSRSESRSLTTSDTAQGSSIAAGGNITLRATGAGDASTLAVTGSDITAGGKVALKADGDLLLQAAQSTATQTSTNASSSASIGVAYSMGGSQNGLSVNASVSKSRGSTDGRDLAQVNTHVAGQQVDLQSGGDTTLKGAVVAADQVTGTIGGKLSIQSLQDTSTYDAKQQSAGAGVSVCLPPLCAGPSTASVNVSNAKAKGDYASVVEQSGIKAGDGGFQLNVTGRTELQGAVITSSQAAADAGKNSLTTASITASDLQNKDNYSASGYSVGVSLSSGTKDSKTQDPQDKTKSLPGGAGMTGGIGQASGSQSSTTTSGISQANITLTEGGTVPATLDRSVVTDNDTSGALKKSWNGQQLMQDVQAQVTITQKALPQLANEIGNYATTKTKPVDDAQTYLDIKSRADKGEAGKTELAWLAKMETAGYSADKANATLSDPQAQADYANWKEGGAARVAAHAALGALGGGLSGAIGAGTSAAATPLLADQVNKLDAPEPLKQALLIASGAAVGGLTGSTAGAVTGGNQVANNFLKHAQAGQMKKDLDACKAKQGGCSTAESDKIFDKYRQLSDQNIAQVQSCIFTGDVSCVNKQLSDAAMHGEVTDTALDSQQEKMLYGRQMNAISGSVTGNRNPLAADAQLAQQVAQFRQANCADPGNGACDAKVVQAMQSTQLGALKLVGLAAGAGPMAAVVSKGPAAVAAVGAAVRGCAANPVLCANTVGIVAADAAADGAIGAGAVAAGAAKVAASVDAAAQDAKAAKVAGSAAAPAVQPGSTPAFVKIEDLYDKPLPLIQLSHTAGAQDGKLGEQLAIQVLNEKTGLNFQPLQNASNHGCDGCVVAVHGDTITVVVMDAKSSQRGVDEAKSAVGDPETKLRGWLQKDSIAGADANKSLAEAIQKALENGAQVKGITVKVGVPAPGTTGAAELKVEPWPKK